ncbi:hypothetical protein IW140_002207 [Coemansia sp. RSA 1813]|nr:hypothetical protein EV178_001715 [Coemansia sp. RSA 1646]KAJ1770549.1 hypothetical protein LPJ74_003076 [Coemansia sp. RSA 1843]KAJ2092970.1 hypothetical protein IW138_000684 [Coemansia sp. RSA 986]KAJ2216291.1 hypothetical protein EV179_001530 [Coemansia sp. RSA 487]KAJ2570536.1 hypothetical protein IW140_002207 [Coemansia sp. RSA 1813]
MVNALHLYRQILRVHRLLPREIRFIGDQYVRAEFRNHRTVTDKRFLEPFFKQWTMYLDEIKQNAQKSAVSDGNNTNDTQDDGSWDIGRHLDRETVESLDDDKAEQLLDLHRASFGADSSKDGSDSSGGSSATPPRRK